MHGDHYVKLDASVVYLLRSAIRQEVGKKVGDALILTGDGPEYQVVLLPSEIEINDDFRAMPEPGIDPPLKESLLRAFDKSRDG